jgi:hypothetical protein
MRPRFQHRLPLWRSFDLYATVQYTWRGIPIGRPTEEHVISVAEVNEDAVRQVLATAASIAMKSPAPLAALRGDPQPGLFWNGAVIAATPNDAGSNSRRVRLRAARL